MEGQALGPGCPSVADLTFSSISQDKVSTTQEDGKIIIGSSAGSSSFKKLAGQGIRLDVVETRMVGETKVKTGEEQRPSCLAGVQSLGCSDVFQF